MMLLAHCYTASLPQFADAKENSFLTYNIPFRFYYNSLNVLECAKRRHNGPPIPGKIGEIRQFLGICSI